MALTTLGLTPFSMIMIVSALSVKQEPLWDRDLKSQAGGSKNSNEISGRVTGFEPARLLRTEGCVATPSPQLVTMVAYPYRVILLVIITVWNQRMARKLSAAHERVRVYRAKMKQQGFRQISIWVPDTKSPKCRQECRRQSRLASAGDQSVRLDDLLNVAAGSVEGWT